MSAQHCIHNGMSGHFTCSASINDGVKVKVKRGTCVINMRVARRRR